MSALFQKLNFKVQPEEQDAEKNKIDETLQNLNEGDIERVVTYNQYKREVHDLTKSIRKRKALKDSDELK